MVGTVVDRGWEWFEDLGYNARKWVTHVIGKAGIKGGAELLAAGAASAIPGAGVEILGLSPAVLIAAPVAGAFSASLTQGDHLHRRDSLLNQYRNEIAGWLTKQTGIEHKPGDMTDTELDLAAFGDKERGIQGNPVLQESLEQSSKERNWGVAISALSSVLSTLVVGGYLHDQLHAMGFPLGPLVGGAVGVALYVPISAGFHWLAESMFGLEKVTINDRVKEMEREHERGKSVSQEQVMEAFLQAQPELSDMIRAGFGRRFSKLDEEQQQQIIMVLGPQLNLAKITDDINHGRMRAEELSFTLFGQTSGATLEGMKEPVHGVANLGVIAKAWDKCSTLFSRHHRANTPAYASVAMQSPDGNDQVAMQAYLDQQPDHKKSFVQMLGRKRSDDGSHSFTEMVGRRESYQASGSYAEVVEQSRSSTEVQVT